MGKIIGCGNPGNYGENLFITIAQEYLDDTNIIYWNRQIFGREFDVCILMPGKGILVVELKGWREENILRVENNDCIIIKTSDGEVIESPQKQARAYRFSLERLIRQNLGKFPLVYQMVCLPQVSKDFYRTQRLDVVTEEKFTLLKEDLETNTAFFNKLNQALREVCNWNRDPFDRRTMLEIRNLFETDINLETELETKPATELAETYREHDYSRFYYLKAGDSFARSELDDIAEQYLRGCKFYCVFAENSQMTSVVSAIDSALTKKGLVRNKSDIAIAFGNGRAHYPQIEAQNFQSFHISMSVLSMPFDGNVESFVIRNGRLQLGQSDLLKKLSRFSQFNADQYLIEHAEPNKNVVVRAGAGTGKTYTMISRIGFICYMQNIPLQKMAERIVMITFTNEAADQMEEKLKAYFRNCYLVTSNAEYLYMISRIDHMQISTIHSYAKKLIGQLGTSFGYGIDVGITSSDFYRRKKISDILDKYISRKQKEQGRDYTLKLGMPVYAIRDNILDFISKLHNKSVDISTIQADDFGSLMPEDAHREVHELLATVIPDVEREYYEELLKEKRLHLSSMMSILNRFVTAPESRSRIHEIKKDKDAIQFMFVDEFQDTDDTQIDSLLTLAQLLDYKLFLVGDIKQCIYRFRGAKEKAFDQLKIAEHPDEWLEFSLQRNYRTDATLLSLFDVSFSQWAARGDELLTYDVEHDRLIGTQEYNKDYLARKERFFRRIPVENDDMRIPALVEEIKRIQRRIKYEDDQAKKKNTTLSDKDRTIAILVRENWQAEMVRSECAKLLPDVTIQTNTGGDLYMSQPAMDMMTLVNALVHFDEAEYLYNLITSNFFDLDVPRSNLYEIRMKIKTGGWRAKVDEREQVNFLIRTMNQMFVNMDDKVNTWEKAVASLRSKPVLQVIRQIYTYLEPWKNFSDDEWKQHYYQLNVDLLFEQLINACNVDRLTINTLQERLYSSIVSQVSVDSRVPASKKNTDIQIQCITVHKSKGLEYGHVILPFCSASIDIVKKSQLHISTAKDGARYQIGYSLYIPDTGETLQNGFYNEVTEKEEKSREEARVLYVAMTRAMRSFSWIAIEGKQNLSWQNLIETEV